MKIKILNDTTDCNGLSEFALVFNGSVGLEKEGLFGASHLLEHCMCEQVKTIEPKLIELGLNWNAFTSNNEVCFILNGLEENVISMMNEFAILILNYKIPKEIFERERNVVLTEYNMYASDQEGEMWMNFMRLKYNSYDTSGRKKNLENLKYEDFMEFKNKYFDVPSYIKYTHSKNSKNLIESNIKEISNLLKDKEVNNISRWNKKMTYGNYKDIDVENNSTFESQRILFICKEFSSYDLDDHSSFTFSMILKDLLNNGLTSILMKEIREKLGFVYGISVSLIHLEQNKFLFLITTSAKKDKIDMVIKKFKEVLSNVVSYLDIKKYKSSIMGMKSKIKTSDCTRYSNILDESILRHRANITSGKFDDSYKKFIDFVLSLNLKSADYFIDTDFKK